MRPAPAPRAWSARSGGLVVTVRLTPRSSRDEIEGCEIRDDGREVLRARVRAAPEDGRANLALLRLLADRLERPAAALSLVSGASGRVKTIAIEGDAAALTARLAAIADAADRKPDRKPDRQPDRETPR